jgi:hypothetical protein
MPAPRLLIESVLACFSQPLLTRGEIKISKASSPSGIFRSSLCIGELKIKIGKASFLRGPANARREN